MSPSLIYLAAAGMQGLATVAVVPVLTRSLGEASFGQFAVALVTGQLLGVLIALGVPAAVARARFSSDGSLDDDAMLDVVSVGVIVVAGGACAVVVARPVWTPLLGSSAPGYLWTWVAAVGVGLALLQLALAALRAFRKAWRYLVIVIASTAGAQGAGAFAASRGGSVVDYFEVYGIGLLASGAFGLVLAHWPSGMHDVRRAVRNCVSYGGVPVVVHGMGVLLIAAGDRWVVERIEGEALVGRYQVAYVVGSVAVVAVAAVNNQWSIDYYATAAADRSRMLQRSLSEVLRFSLLAVVTVCGVGPTLLPLLGGPDVRTSTLLPLSAVVAVAAVPYVLYLGGVHVLFVHGRTRVLATSTAFAAVCNLGFNALVVPVFSIHGAAAATLVTYSLWAKLVRRSARTLAAVPGVPTWVVPSLAGVVIAVVVLENLPTEAARLVGAMVATASGVAALVQLTQRQRW